MNSEGPRELLLATESNPPAFWLRIQTALSPRWSDFSRVGNSALLKTSFIWLFAVPISAKVCSKLGPDVSIQLLGETWLLQLGLPFSWKLFYFSSVAFTIAVVLYGLFCPAIIREHPTYAHFREEGKGSRQVRDYFCDHLSKSTLSEEAAALVSTYLLEFSREYSKGARSLHETHVGSLIDLMTLVIESDIPDSRRPDAFWFVRSVADGSKPSTRILTGILFALGFILIGGVLAQNFVYVWHAAFSQ